MADSKQNLLATLLTFRDIAAPLMNAVTETGGINANIEGRAEHTPENHAALFAQLMELTGALTKKTAAQLGAEALPPDDWIRWHLSTTIANLVSSYYRATANPMPSELAESFIGVMMQAARAGADDNGQPGTETVMSRVKAVNALIPALSAIARFAFGRPEAELMNDITARIRTEARNLTESLAAASLEAAEKSQLFDGLLEALGKIYAEAHYAEMDRLLDMPPDERARYVQSYENKPPMEPVWDAFRLRLNMLNIVVQNIYLSDSAQIIPPSGAV